MFRPSTPRLHLICASFLFAVQAATLGAFAADGDLDPNFDGDGMASVQFSAPWTDQAEDVAVLMDGSVLVAGSQQFSSTDHDFAVAKLTHGGLVDTTFGGGSGQATVAFDLGGGLADLAQAIAVQNDGKIVIAGYAETSQSGNYDLAVARLHANGTRDYGFGTSGKVSYAVDLGGTNFDIATDVLIQADGKIVLTGWSQGAGFNSDFVAVRLHSDGSVDTSFGSQGRAVVSFDLGGQDRDESAAAALQSDGKIVLVGSVERWNLDFDFGIVRLLTDGSLDGSLGNGGKVTVAFDRGGSNQDQAEDVAIDSSDRLVLAGRSGGTTYADHDFAVARILSNGSLDTSFGSGGKTTVDIGGGLGLDQAFDVALAPFGKIVVAGTTFFSSTDTDFAAVRLNSNGSVDTQFGSNGRARVAFDIGGDHADDCHAMAVGLDGGIVMAGPADTHWGIRLVGVARLQGTPWVSF